MYGHPTMIEVECWFGSDTPHDQLSLRFELIMGHPLRGFLIAALVHAGEAVVPAEAVGVYPGPEQAQAEGDGGEQEG